MGIDERIISQAVSTHRNGETITDLQARVIANAWHSGMRSELYRLTSTGTITADLLDELSNESGDTADELAALADYARTYGPREPQPGWSELSW